MNQFDKEDFKIKGNDEGDLAQIYVCYLKTDLCVLVCLKDYEC